LKAKEPSSLRQTARVGCKGPFVVRRVLEEKIGRPKKRANSGPLHAEKPTKTLRPGTTAKTGKKEPLNGVTIRKDFEARKEAGRDIANETTSWGESCHGARREEKFAQKKGASTPAYWDGKKKN